MNKKVPYRFSGIGSLLLKKTNLVAAVLLALGGCSQFQPLQRPDVALPAQWPQASAAGAAVSVGQGGLPWQGFIADAKLKTLVEQALANNQDARVAALQVAQVRAQYRIRDAARWPVVAAGITSSRQTVGDNEPIKSTLTSGLQVAAWEIDLFGRLESLKEAALAQYLATEEAQRGVQLSLVTAVASAWLSERANQAQLSLIRQTLAGREASLRLTRLRFDHGVASALDLRQAESLAAAAQVALAQQQRQWALDRHALALLVGQPVADGQWAAASPATGVGGVAEPVLAEVPVGLPSAVLLLRPDIAAAEQQLVAANAQMGAARAAFFPRVSLTASLGSASSELSGLFKAGSWGWSLAPQALLPIFDRGANQAGLESAQAGRDIALAQYEKAIQGAFKEVNDALASRHWLADQQAAQQRLVAAEAERVRLSTLRVDQGVAGQLELLDAQRSLFAAQQSLLQTQLALSLNRVALFKATAGA